MGAALQTTEESGIYRISTPPEGPRLEGLRQAAGGQLPLAEVLRIADVLLFHVERAHVRGLRLGHVNTESVMTLPNGGLSLTGADRSHAELPPEESGDSERCREQRERQDDVFVVGALLYVLLAGEEPRVGPQGPLAARALFAAPVPSKVARAIARALHPRRAVRWRDVAELREALFATEGARPTLPERTRAPEEWPILLVRRLR